jgi:murein L,D-transpeptidase YafK
VSRPLSHLQISRTIPNKLMGRWSLTKWVTVRATLLVLLLGTVAWASGRTAAPAKKADLIIIVKSTRTMTLYSAHTVLKMYKVALSRDPVGPKERAGDHKVPEGNYIVDAKNPHSRFHLALHVSYPNAADRERARNLGVNPGGNIEIHGLPDKYAWLGSVQHYVDWTDGCIAVTDSEIEQIYPLVPVGTRVEIRP